MTLLDILNQNKDNTVVKNHSNPEQIDDLHNETIDIQCDLAHLTGINEQLRTTNSPSIYDTLEATMEALDKHKTRLLDIANQFNGVNDKYLMVLNITESIRDIDQELDWLKTLKNIYTVAYNAGYNDAR